MSASGLRIAYFAHTVRSDWNNGNAHFLRGLLRSLGRVGHEVTVYEPEREWSVNHLREEADGDASLAQFEELYSDLDVQTYAAEELHEGAAREIWLERLRGTDIVILHEWNPPAVAKLLLSLRDALGFALLFHDTHHRASSSPESFATLGLDRFDGVLAFGDALRTLYRERFGLTRVWTLHEAADVTVFRPIPGVQPREAIVWIGNWGDDERSAEIRDYLLQPAQSLAHEFRTRIYGVRYPREGLAALHDACVEYGGYLPNLKAPCIYASAKLTVHIPRQQYTQAMTGIPTIRVFEALACGIPLVSAPWQDTEHLFREGDFIMAHSPAEMHEAMSRLLHNPQLAFDRTQRGLETVLAHHTCDHRARELTHILKELTA